MVREIKPALADVKADAQRVVEQTMEQARSAVDSYFTFVQKIISSYPSGGTELGEKLKSSARCRRALCWNSIWRDLQRHKVIGSSGEVNWLIDGRRGKRLPAVDLTHVDLARGEQRPEQHGGSLC